MQSEESNYSALKAMHRTRARYDLHGAVVPKQKELQGVPARDSPPTVRRQALILRLYPERARTFDLRVSLLTMQSVPNRLDSGEASKRLTVDS